MKIHFGCDFGGMFCILKTLFICIEVSETVKGKSFLELVSSVISVVADSFQPHVLQHTRLPCPLPTPGACSNSCPLSW